VLGEIPKNGEGLSTKAQLLACLPEPFFLEMELKRGK
jgi:hypothetical protein